MEYAQESQSLHGFSSSAGLFVVSTLALILFVRLASWFITHAIRIHKISAVVSRVPGPKGHWFWGHLFTHPGPGEEGIAWNLRMMETLPKYHHFYDGWWKPCVALKHPDCIKVLLKTAQPKATSVGGVYFYLIPWLGNGLLLSSGPQWFRNRKLLTPGFHFDVLKPYMNVYHHAANVLISKFEAAGRGGSSVEIFNHVSLCTLDVMLRCAFTFESNVQTDDNQYVSAVKSIASLLLDRAFKPGMLSDTLYYRSPNGKSFKKLCDYVHGIADDLIHTRRRSIKEDTTAEGKKYVDFLDILLLAKDENGEGLSHEEIRNEVDTFLFEGHDTTASAISWILYALAKHPQFQINCQEEIDSVIEDPNKPYISWDDLQRLPYLTRCVKESMRLHPPVPAIVRELTSPLTIDEFTFPPGTTFEVNIFDLHHNPSVWGPDPEDYQPDRFKPEKMEKMDSHAFLPFSAGPRNCIGQNFAMHEIKVIVARILQHFTLSVDDSHPVERYPIMTLSAKQGIKLFFKSRQ